MSDLLVALSLVEQVNGSIGANSCKLAGRVRVGSRGDLLVLAPLASVLILDDAVQVHELISVVKVGVALKVGDSETSV